jgi:hypothetical protein
VHVDANFIFGGKLDRFLVMIDHELAMIPFVNEMLVILVSVDVVARISI